MSSYDSDPLTPAFEPLPRLDEIPTVSDGLDPAAVAAAFERFEREIAHARAKASPLPALIDTGRQEARMDALRLIRAAAEFADVLERDAQEVAARQMSLVQDELHRREGDLRARETELLTEQQELERRRAELVASARREAEELIAAAHRTSSEARHEAELAKLRVLEEARHHIGELTSATRAEVEHTLEWSRAQADGIVRRARSVAEQLLTASLRGDRTHVAEVVDAIVRATDAQVGPVPAALSMPRRPELDVVPPAEDALHDDVLEGEVEADDPELTGDRAMPPGGEAYPYRPVFAAGQEPLPPPPGPDGPVAPRHHLWPLGGGRPAA